jgi:predicted outer membrane protein
MNFAAACCLLIGTVSLASPLAAQRTGDGSLSEAALYSLYVTRHVATVAFANLAATRATDGDIRKAAQDLETAHREARERLERIAGERHLTLAPPERDTSTALLEHARKTLNGLTGRAFDSAWTELAHDWLFTLVLDNNRVVKARIGADLQSVAVQHTTWLFHQSSDIEKLRKKFR